MLCTQATHLLRSLTFQITDDGNDLVWPFVLQFVLLLLWFQKVPSASSGVSCGGDWKKIYPRLRGILVITRNFQTPHSSMWRSSLEPFSNKFFFQIFFNPSILTAFCVINSRDKIVIQLSALTQNILFTRARVWDYRNNCHSTFISCQVPVLVLPQMTSHTVNPMNGQ